MGIFVTVNYSGSYDIKPRTAVGKDPAGGTIWRDGITIYPARLGVSVESGEVIGLVDTSKLPQPTENACKEWFGKKDWQKILDDEIENGPHNLRLLKPGETIEVDNIDIQALEGQELPPSLARRKTTTIQGPMTAGALTGAGGKEVREKSVAIKTKVPVEEKAETEKDE